MTNAQWSSYALELLRIALSFLSSIAYPLVVVLVCILFREPFGEILKTLRLLLEGVAAGRLALKGNNWMVTAVQKLRTDTLDSAAKTIQELLSPAAPLALGYVDNFLAGFHVTDKGRGGFKYAVEDALKHYKIADVFTIYIPRDLSTKEHASSLVHEHYGDERIVNISIESKYGRPLTGFAVLRPEQGTIYPVDVPKTLTSIQHVFRFREKQLQVEANMGTDEIHALERQNLDEFAQIVLKRATELPAARSIRVIRKPSALFVDE